MSKLPTISLAQLRPKTRKSPKPAIVLESKKYSVYTCPELGRTCTRPNAYDAFELPSIYGGERKPYRFAESLP